MRAVLDTNILARAASPSRGPAREVLDRLCAPPHVLVLSAFIVSELNRVLRYDRVRHIHGLDDAGIDRFVAFVEAAGIPVLLPQGQPQTIVSQDPDDDPIVATAVSGQADVLCTRDRHLYDPAVQAYCSARGIHILSDLELLKVLRSASSAP